MTLHWLQCIIIIFEWCCSVGCCCWWCHQTEPASKLSYSFDINEYRSVSHCFFFLLFWRFWNSEWSVCWLDGLWRDGSWWLMCWIDGRASGAMKDWKVEADWLFLLISINVFAWTIVAFQAKTTNWIKASSAIISSTQPSHIQTNHQPLDRIRIRHPIQPSTTNHKVPHLDIRNEQDLQQPHPSPSSQRIINDCQYQASLHIIVIIWKSSGQLFCCNNKCIKDLCIGIDPCT